MGAKTMIMIASLSATCDKGERLDCPIDKEHYPDAAPMCSHSAQGCEVNAQQHWDDHQPDQHCDGKIHLCHFRSTDAVKEAGYEMAGPNANEDAEKDPDSEIALKQ